MDSSNTGLLWGWMQPLATDRLIHTCLNLCALRCTFVPDRRTLFTQGQPSYPLPLEVTWTCLLVFEHDSAPTRMQTFKSHAHKWMELRGWKLYPVMVSRQWAQWDSPGLWGGTSEGFLTGGWALQAQAASWCLQQLCSQQPKYGQSRCPDSDE